MTEREALLCLNAVCGLGSVKIKRLCECFSNPCDVWRAGEQELRRVEGIGKEIAKNILSFDCRCFLKEELALVAQQQVRVITLVDADYPALLKEIFDPPVVLYCRGKEFSHQQSAVAIVGSRRASVYGMSVAGQFASDLACHGVAVVSGMARGIDFYAHRECVKAGGYTIAVLGSGLCHLYPKENQPLFEEIIEHGCAVSEFPMTTPPVAGNFPRRNRIISGLSLGVIVVEASTRSGALITARCALDQGREVFAVPGKLGQAQASGTNRLIQQGAKLVCGIEDVLDEFPEISRPMSCGDSSGDSNTVDHGVSDAEQAVYRLLSDEPMYIDEVLARSCLPRPDAMRLLLALECRKAIKKLPGHYYIKSKMDITTYG
ncbi:MAG TPA: DNA-processing protein DprA [Candidatus Bathyarchaeia archaeon]|nr:DNA-processing protein DprA [Candidatus Bathyarchaeia archaeon]